MKKKVFLVIAAMIVLGLGLAVYAFNSTQTTSQTTVAACCSCCGDSCPMKSKDATVSDVKMTAENGHDCSCCGDSCPMKSSGATASVSSTDAKIAAESGHDCSCCGDSCPMKHNADAATDCPMHHKDQ